MVGRRLTTNSTDMSFSELWEIVKDREAWHAAVHGVTRSWTQLNNNNHFDWLPWWLRG